MEIISSGLIEYSKPLIIPKLVSRFDLNKHNNDSIKEHKYLDDFKILFTLCAADDISYKIDDNGLIVLDKLKVSLKDRLLFSIRLLFESRNVTINPKTINGWSEFIKAVKIKDRVTHPKSLSDLAVTMEDYQTVKMSLAWVVNCILFRTDTKSN